MTLIPATSSTSRWDTRSPRINVAMGHSFTAQPPEEWRDEDGRPLTEAQMSDDQFQQYRGVMSVPITVVCDDRRRVGTVKDVDFG